MDLRSPSTLAQAWVLFPLLVLAGSFGLGVLMARAGGRSLGVLTVPAGFLGGVSLMTFLLSVGLGGKLTVVLTALAAVAGIVLGARAGWERRHEWRPLAPWLWPTLAALFAFVAGMAPIVGSARSAVLGYVLNNDSTVHIVIVESIARDGARIVDPDRDSFHHTTVEVEAGYPLGGHVWPLFDRVLTGTDPFHLWSPASAITLGVLALVMFALLRTLLVPRALAAIGGGLAGTTYLVYAYHSQGGGKEVLMPVAVYGAIALAARALADDGGWRSLVPASVAGVAPLAALGYGGLAWLGPAGLLVLAVFAVRLWRKRDLAVLRPIPLALAVGLLLAVPTVSRTLTFFEGAEDDIADPNEVGNLLAALPFSQALGVWWSFDYRQPIPDEAWAGDVGAWVAGLLCIGGLLYAVWRRNLAIPVAIVAGYVAWRAIEDRSSIYYSAKALVVLAPALALGTVAGLAAIASFGRRARWAVVGVAGLLAVGAVVSNVYTYANVWVTPRFRFAEMGAINERFAKKGPMLVNEREQYAPHLLRDASSWAEWGVARVPERGLRFPGNYPAAVPRAPDFDDYTNEHIQRFPLLLERKRPGGSLPPSNYRPVHETKHYRVWERFRDAPAAHVPLGTDGQEGATTVACRRGVPQSPELAALLDSARATQRNVRVSFGAGAAEIALPVENWISGRGVRVAAPQGQVGVFGGLAAGAADVPSGRYAAWVQGTFGAGMRVFVRTLGMDNFGPIGTVFDDLSESDSWHRIGVIDVRGGRVLFSVDGLDREWYRAGGDHFSIVGPIVLERGDPPAARVVEQPPGRSLCGRRVDWIELV